MAAPSQPLWYSGVCDQLLQKIARWLQNYEKGAVSRTRKFLHPKDGLIDIPTQYVHGIPFRQAEVDHLVRIMTTLCPKQAGLLDMLRIVQRDLKKNRMVHTGEFMAPMPFFKADVQLMFDTLMDAKAGVKPEAEAELKQKANEGKFLWN